MSESWARQSVLGRTILLFALANCSSAIAATERQQTSFEFGYILPSGVGTGYLTPTQFYRFGVVTRYDLSEFVSFSSEVGFNGMVSQSGFAGLGVSYWGFGIAYSPCIKLRLSSEGFSPYVRFGPSSQAVVVLLSGAGADVSPNQVALKVGYTAGMGFDLITSTTTGQWGIGLGVSYDSYLNGPVFLDFPAAPQAIQSLRIDFRIHLGF